MNFRDIRRRLNDSDQVDNCQVRGYRMPEESKFDKINYFEFEVPESEYQIRVKQDRDPKGSRSNYEVELLYKESYDFSDGKTNWRSVRRCKFNGWFPSSVQRDIETIISEEIGLEI